VSHPPSSCVADTTLLGGSHRTACFLLLKALNLNSVNQLIFVMVKCGVLFEVRTEFLNNI
jgi:CBS-domain-containing membrane protein